MQLAVKVPDEDGVEAQEVLESWAAEGIGAASAQAAVAAILISVKKMKAQLFRSHLDNQMAFAVSQ